MEVRVLSLSAASYSNVLQKEQPCNCTPWCFSWHFNDRGYIWLCNVGLLSLSVQTTCSLLITIPHIIPFQIDGCVWSQDTRFLWLCLKFSVLKTVDRAKLGFFSSFRVFFSCTTLVRRVNVKYLKHLKPSLSVCLSDTMCWTSLMILGTLERSVSLSWDAWLYPGLLSSSVSSGALNPLERWA